MTKDATIKLSRLNPHVNNSNPSETYEVINRIVEKRELGETVISLCAGEPDFDTPAHICSAAIDAINSGYTRYTQVAGIKALRQAVAKKFQTDNGISTNWKQTIIGAGGKHIIFNALLATLSGSDEVIIPAPYWVSYPEMVEMCGGKTIIVSGEKDNAFKISPKALDRAITSRTKWLILNSPSNPTGAIYSKKELLNLAEILRKHPHVMVLSDDIYEHLVFDDLRFNTMAEVAPDLEDRVLTMNGVSKAYAMTGWRIGFATGPNWLIDAMIKIQGQQTSGPCSISQHAALAALIGPKDFLESSKVEFTKRRDIVVERLNRAPGLSCEAPSGAFYIFANCSGLIGKTTHAGKHLKSDKEVATALLEEKNIAVVQGSAFGISPYLRIAYALNEDSLRRACEGIQHFCESLSD